METINVELKLDHKVCVDLRLDEVIDGINDCEMKRRWNYVAQIMNEVQLGITDLTDEHRGIVREYLEGKLAIFSAYGGEKIEKQNGGE